MLAKLPALRARQQCPVVISQLPARTRSAPPPQPNLSARLETLQKTVSKRNLRHYCQWLLPVVALVSLTTQSVCAQPSDPERHPVGEFSSGSTRGWQPIAFKHATQYQIVRDGPLQVLRATSSDSASGLVYRQRIDLARTPYLVWRWKIANPLDNVHETTRAGDDYAARIYVVIDGGLLFWKTRALNYVWAYGSAPGTTWPNAFAGSNAKMLALRWREDPVDTWQTEKRNVRADLRQVFGRDIRYIDAVALMTDTDNTGATVTAYYGDIYFSAQ